MTHITLNRVMEMGSLSEAEAETILRNYDIYGELIERLDLAFQKFQRSLKESDMLDSKIASLTYANYEAFMNVHINAIMISAQRAKANLMGIPLNGEVSSRIDRILDLYLLLTH